ncbi:CRISPR-associated endonuclease Cas1 [Parabacteroides pacaensis]|uniref:CRISPR-associated endonuclease Cas1 n=1 Tax=Parabacteroides pacaensis TaxID=2086575 RepID=UPI000D0FD08A|nr:CRISPR-associated endonuclease Cas1 [Parabacteroides pacaensis]
MRIHKLIEKKSASIPNKSVLKEGLKTVEFLTDEINLSRSILIKDFVETYLKSLRSKSKQSLPADNKKLINRKKKEYQKRENEGSELIVTTPGSFIGKTNKGITVKLKGTVINRKPTNALKHITITGQGVTISSNAIQYCVNQKIVIDFFDKQSKHYASLLSPISMDGLLWKQQSMLSLENKAVLGKRIILGKLKNQKNLIKYYHKYHKDSADVLKEKYIEVILRLDECIQRVKNFEVTDEQYAPVFMGQEAVGAVAYWDYIRLLIMDDEVNFVARIHQGATDIVNSMLNYGYAILYARVWDAVLLHKLNPSISVLHAPQTGKPTFVYDLVELFRAQAVDRVVISLIQKGEPLKMAGNLLCEPTKKLLIQNILERLNRYEKYRGEELRFIDIINKQILEVAAFISGESKTFKPYIAKW